MKISIWLKSGLGLIYTTILLAAAYFGTVWLTKFIINFTWLGAILFWIIGLPITIGLFQFLASVAAIPSVYLLKGSKWLSWVLLLPTLFFLYCLGSFLWELASTIGGILTWLLLISWFCESAWLFVAYFMVAIGSAHDTGQKRSVEGGQYVNR